MNTAFRTSFDRDLKRIADQTLRDRVAEAIRRVEAAGSLAAVQGVKPLGGAFFRIRVGDYRIGIRLDGDIAIFERCLHRREIYRFFP